MMKPRLEKYGLNDSDYKSFKEYTSKLEKRFANMGAVIGVVIGILYHLITADEFSGVGFLIPGFLGLIFGSIAFLVIFRVFRESFLKRNPLYFKVEAFEKDLLSYQQTTESYWKNLSGREFEEALGGLFEKDGYEVEFTPVTGDKGIDLILVKGGMKTIVQCKAHAKAVGPATVRDLYGTLMSFRAPMAILASTSGFTKGVYEFAEKKRIELMGLEQIIELSEKVVERN